MPLLLTRANLTALLSDQRNLDTAFRAIEDTVLLHKRGEAGYAAFLRLPLATDEQAMSVYATSPQQATTLRVFPFVGTAGPRPGPNQHVMLLLDSSTGRDAIRWNIANSGLRTANPADPAPPVDDADPPT